MTSKPSGRFLLRLPPREHAALRAAAKAAGVSLNEHCRRALAASLAAPPADPSAHELVARAARQFGAQLLGVVVFGSWARGEAGSGSDVDVLLVVEKSLTLTRALYREWDVQPPSWEGRAVEAHFVHLPDVRAPGTLWAEAAVDGLLLHDREFVVSRRLAELRRAIVSGRLVRRVVHGQPYWAEVA